ACLQLVLEPQGADKAHLFRGAGQVRLERVLALQHVEHRAAGLVRRVRLRFEGFCADKPGQLEHFVDVLFEPGIELVEDGPINTQGHFVDRPVGYHAIVRISHGLWRKISRSRELPSFSLWQLLSSLPPWTLLRSGPFVPPRPRSGPRWCFQ